MSDAATSSDGYAAPLHAGAVRFDPLKRHRPDHAFHPHGVMSALASGLSI
jgi:hypothetical protein